MLSSIDHNIHDDDDDNTGKNEGINGANKTKMSAQHHETSMPIYQQKMHKIKTNIHEQMSPDIARDPGGNPVQYCEIINAIKMDNANDNDGRDIDDVSDSVQVFVSAKNGSLALQALLDTGALDGNYINVKTSMHLQSLGMIMAPSTTLVCTAVRNSSQCAPAASEAKLSENYINELTNENETLN